MAEFFSGGAGLTELFPLYLQMKKNIKTQYQRASLYLGLHDRRKQDKVGINGGFHQSTSSYHIFILSHHSQLWDLQVSSYRTVFSNEQSHRDGRGLVSSGPASEQGKYASN